MKQDLDIQIRHCQCQVNVTGGSERTCVLLYYQYGTKSKHQLSYIGKLTFSIEFDG